jgi:hypothetical protein
VANRSPIAAEAIQRIGTLYAIEREIRGKMPAERVAVRQQRLAALLERLHAWLSATLRTVSAKSPLVWRSIRAGALDPAHPLSR